MGGEFEDNKGISAIIAASVGLLSLQFDQVPIFFQTIFPKLGIGLSIILVLVILVGLFIDFKKYEGPTSIFFGIAGLIAVVIILSSLSDYSWWSGGFWQENMSSIIAGIIVIIFIAIVIGSGKKKPEERRFYHELGKP
jgi:NADH:ubiquinone oxidoreductase subunit 2 (subunit N)